MSEYNKVKNESQLYIKQNVLKYRGRVVNIIFTRRRKDGLDERYRDQLREIITV